MYIYFRKKKLFLTWFSRKYKNECLKTSFRVDYFNQHTLPFQTKPLSFLINFILVNEEMERNSKKNTINKNLISFSQKNLFRSILLFESYFVTRSRVIHPFHHHPTASQHWIGEALP